MGGGRGKKTKKALPLKQICVMKEPAFIAYKIVFSTSVGFTIEIVEHQAEGKLANPTSVQFMTKSFLFIFFLS